MAKDEERLGRGSFLNRRVPDHYALGRPKSGHVGIERGDLLTGLHQEHAVALYRESASLRNAFQLLHELWVCLIQWLKFVEQWINDIRSNHDQEKQARQSDQPEVKPPTAWALADDPVHQKKAKSCDDDGDELSLGEVAKPRSPALHRESVLPADAVLVGVQGQVQEI